MKWFWVLIGWTATMALADDRAILLERFSQTEERGITIPPGDYILEGETPIPLPSNVTIQATGARFFFPDELPDRARRLMFAGENVSHLVWEGGEFVGRVFDPAEKVNSWLPNANTKGIEITTTEVGGTHDITFRNVRSHGVAGAVIGVHGWVEKGQETDVLAYAERVTIQDCTLLRSGKFMWDYGYLWQVMTFPESYEPWEVERARGFFRTDLIRSDVVLTDGEDRVRFDNRKDPLPVSLEAEPREALSFLTPDLPRNLRRGKAYYIVASGEDFVQISETPGGEAIVFEGSSGASTQMVYNLSTNYLGYAPTGSGPGKGAFDITGARDVRVTGCMLSALGDTMHIHSSRNVIFANNHILGSRMGAFFLAEYCQNATITGNLVDGGNGSRVMSVERSCTDVTITGNTFRNGGRGAWINQPVNLIIANNLFINNTTKDESDLRRGRISWRTGEPVRFPELYFTVYEDDGHYGPVIVRDNIFQVGDAVPEEAVTFAPGGHDLEMTNNVFSGRPITIVCDPANEAVRIENNRGAKLEKKALDPDHGRR